MIRKTPLAASLLALTLALTACSSAAAPTPTPTPEPTYASEAAVASVIAAKEPGWREVIDNAGECRLLWVVRSTPTEELQATTCYLREQTLTVEAETVLKELAGLRIDPDMEILVSSTETVLKNIRGVGFTNACGPDALPVESAECSAAMAGLYSNYSALEEKLDAWRVYF
jgi:hypothetical protein